MIDAEDALDSMEGADVAVGYAKVIRGMRDTGGDMRELLAFWTKNYKELAALRASDRLMSSGEMLKLSGEINKDNATEVMGQWLVGRNPRYQPLLWKIAEALI